DRARRLREKGAAALSAYLDKEVGERRRVLIELNQLGRTEAFTPVRFSSSVARGDLREVTILGHDGRELLAA
ncbi:MAG: tRNA ((6)-L-threonylcarbamoyladenosine(37)-C(2))-methylthiotransferase MtaB, partial [Xanthobacteraceae bacterium]|nr:tRNA ((6)-L-threonylcarbamoyladenosine(37)-C(2))-methylthiotransferase MtaB [Xanthobacteraceae bacterium]